MSNIETPSKRVSFRKSGNQDLPLQAWRRIFAGIIDGFTIYILFIKGAFLLVPLVIWQKYIVIPYNELASRWIIFQLISLELFLQLLLLLAYFSITESSSLQGSLGKRFMRMRVTTLEGNPITFPQALLRNVTKIVTLFTVIGVFFIDIHPLRQALHDMAAKTKVHLR
jgi:uncharacterized RDD family membrane protein YckC